MNGKKYARNYKHYFTIFIFRFEDGTLPFLSITSVRHGFETFKRLSLDMELISTHTFSLAKYVHHSLLLMHHSNGNPIAVLYHDTNFENKNYQGAIVNFNLLRANGQYIGYSEVCIRILTMREQTINTVIFRFYKWLICIIFIYVQGVFVIQEHAKGI